MCMHQNLKSDSLRAHCLPDTGLVQYSKGFTAALRSLIVMSAALPFFSENGPVLFIPIKQQALYLSKAKLHIHTYIQHSLYI